MLPQIGGVNPLPAYLQALEYEDAEIFPAEALNEAVQHREEAIPYLLHSLEWACEHPYAENENGDVYSLHIYALFLLASFREPRAYPLVLQMFMHPEADAIVGDLTAEVGERILASVCGSQDTRPIEQGIEDLEQDELVRATLVSTLGVLAQNGSKTREEVVAYFRRLLRGRPEAEDSIFWHCFVGVCEDLGMAELLPEIRDLYQTGVVKPAVEDLKELELRIVQPSSALARYSLIDDPVAEIQGWERGREEDDEIFAEVAEEFGLDPNDSRSIFETLAAADLNQGRLPTPEASALPKVGRNDQCPCGSGKKFKKCCGKDGNG